MPSSRVTCPDCGQRTSADTIHTCSPQAREPIRVEVEACPSCDGVGRCHSYCDYIGDWTGRVEATLTPGSLAEAMLELARAVLEGSDASDANLAAIEALDESDAGSLDRLNRCYARCSAARRAYDTALARVRNHPDYRRTDA